MANNDNCTARASSINTMTRDEIVDPSLYIRAPPTIVRGLLESPLVTINVTENVITKTYELNRADICAKFYYYFKAAFLNSMQKSKTREITLNDGITHKTMGLLVNWLQSGLVYLDEGGNEVASTSGCTNRSREGSYRSLAFSLLRVLPG